MSLIRLYPVAARTTWIRTHHVVRNPLQTRVRMYSSRQPLDYDNLLRDQNPYLVLKTLISNPECGEQVSKLDIADCEWRLPPNFVLADDDVRQFNAAAARFGMTNGWFRILFPRRRNYMNARLYQEMLKRRMNAAADLIIQHCPNLRELRYSPDQMHCIHRPATLDKLERIQVEGFEFPPHMNVIPRGADWLARCAPNLDRLSLRDVEPSTLSLVGHDNLTTLDMIVDWPPIGRFATVFSKFPKMHTFLCLVREYRLGVAAQVNDINTRALGECADAVLNHAPMRRFEMNLVWCGQPQYKGTADNHIGGLAKSKLQVVGLGMEELQHPGPYSSDFFVALLPRTLRHLHLRAHPEHDWGLAELAALVPTHFPRLGRVMLKCKEGYEGNDANMASEFESVGVKFHVHVEVRRNGAAARKVGFKYPSVVGVLVRCSASG